jgi:hypothetical protein
MTTLAPAAAAAEAAVAASSDVAVLTVPADIFVRTEVMELPSTACALDIPGPPLRPRGACGIGVHLRIGMLIRHFFLIGLIDLILDVIVAVPLH